MITKILIFFGLYFLIKNMLKSFFAESEPLSMQNKEKTSHHDVIDAEFKVIKEE